MKVTREMVDALRTLRLESRKWFDQNALDALDILDNAGVFKAVDEHTGYDIDGSGEKSCTCPSALVNHLRDCRRV